MRPFQRLFLISFILLLPIVTVAKTRTPSSTAAPHAFSGSQEGSHTLVLTGIGLMDYYSGIGFSIYGGAAWRITPQHPIYLGFESGLDFFGSHNYGWYNGISSSFTAIPLLATAMYRFELPRVPGLHPYAGLGLGPSITLSSGINTNRNVVVEFAVRPGISWNLQDGLALHGESRFGLIGDSFFWAPSVGVTFFL